MGKQTMFVESTLRSSPMFSENVAIEKAELLSLHPQKGNHRKGEIQKDNLQDIHKYISQMIEKFPAYPRTKKPYRETFPFSLHIYIYI